LRHERARDAEHLNDRGVVPVSGALGGQEDTRGDASRARFADELCEPEQNALRPTPLFSALLHGSGSR